MEHKQASGYNIALLDASSLKGRHLIGAFSRPLLSAALLSLLLTCACGYRVAGSSTPGLPAAIQTIAIPAFQNETSRFKIEQTLTQAVFHEFLTRTSYRLQSQETGSDAVLKGTITAIYSSPIVFDPSSGRTTEVLLTVSLRVVMLDARTQETIYEASNFVFREPYEVSTDAATYIEESQPALERLAREVAASLVSTIIENF